MPANFEGGCPAPEQLSAYLEGRLAPDAARPFERHLRHCNACQLAAAAGVSDSDIREVDALAPGQLIAERFSLQARLEQSSRVETWRAFDSEQQRPVALEFLRVLGAPQVCALALLGETRKMAGLKAAGVTPLYDAGIHEGLAFLATEPTPGPSLGEWSESGRHPWREVVQRFVPLCEGVSTAHRAGLIHGAISPDCINVDDEGQLWVRGFGLLAALRAAIGVDSTATSFSYAAIRAKSVVRESPLPGIAPETASPELLAGREPSLASDIFGLCLSLYEALTGMKPFIASTPEELLAKMTRNELLFPSSPRLPAPLRDVLARGLSFNPARRFESAKALAEALSAVLGRRRRKLVRLATASAVVGSLALLGSGLWQYRASQCREGAAVLAGFFGPSAEAGWRRAWQHVKGANLEGLSRFDSLLLAYKEGWAEAHQMQCEATLQTPWASSPARACLEEQAALLGTMGAVAREGSAQSHVVATRALKALESPRACLGKVDGSGAGLLGGPRAMPRAMDGRLLRARVLLMGGEYAAAEKEARSVLDASPRQNGPHEELEALAMTGQALSALGRHAEAAPLLARAAAMAEVQSHDSLRPALLLAWSKAAGASPKTRSEARLLLDAALAASKRLGDRPAFEGQALTLRAQLALAEGQPEAAESLLEQSLARHRSVEALVLLGETLMQRHRASDAAARYAEALTETRGLHAAGDALLRKLSRERATAAVSAGKFAEALPLLEAEVAAAGSVEQALGRGDVDTLLLHARLAGVKGAMGQPDEALPLLESMVDRIREKKLSPGATEEVLRTLADLYVARGDSFKGAMLARENLLRLSASLPPSSPLLARARCALGQARLVREDVTGAVSAFQEGLESVAVANQKGPDTWCLHAGLALAKVELGELDAVEPHVTAVLEQTVSADTVLARRSRSEVLYARARVAYFKGERDRGPELVGAALRELEGLEGAKFDAMRKVIQKLPEEMTGEAVEQSRKPAAKKAKPLNRSRRRARTAEKGR